MGRNSTREALQRHGLHLRRDLGQNFLVDEIADQPVESMATMVTALRSHEPGETVEIVVTRGDARVDCSVELASHLDSAA